MSVPGMHALRVLLELKEQQVWMTDAEDTADENPFADCIKGIGLGMLEIAEKTVRPENHGDFVELYDRTVPAYEHGYLLPHRMTRDDQQKLFVSLSVPRMQQHVCHPEDEPKYADVFGMAGWWLYGIVLAISDHRGPDRKVETYVVMADKWRGSYGDDPLTPSAQRFSYIVLTLLPHCFLSERIVVEFNPETLQDAVLGRTSRADMMRIRPEMVTDTDDIIYRGAEAQLTRDLQHLGAFLRSFAEHYARDRH